MKPQRRRLAAGLAAALALAGARLARVLNEELR